MGMWPIMLAAVNTALAFIVRSVIVKFVVFFALFFVVTEFIEILSPLLPNGGAITGAMGSIPSGVWFFLDLFNVSAGFPLLLTAYVTRFIIRRIPVIG